MTGIPAQLGAVRRHRLYEEIAGRLEAMIHDGQYLPGDRLPSERDLMKHFGVGRPAVREALFALQKMGLVAINSGERARITQPTPKVVFESLAGAARHLLAAPDGVRHFQEARVLFEVSLARFAAAHATSSDLAELKRALEANHQALDSIYEFERTDVAFHYVLAVIPRNPIFTAIHEAIAAWLIEQRAITLQTPGQKFIAYRAHEEIFDAIAARDPGRAEGVIRAHLDQVAATYWQAQEEEEYGRIRRHGGLPAETRNVRSIPQDHRRKRARVGAR
jgi:GntR family transcriptional repressor for pyruvate dehydrogenase complex